MNRKYQKIRTQTTTFSTKVKEEKKAWKTNMGKR